MKYLLFVFIVFVYACSSMDNEIDIALNHARKNRKELENALSFYRERAIENDTVNLKLRSVKFLIKNMKWKFYLSGKGVDEFNEFIDSVYQIKQQVYDVASIYDQFRKQSKFQQQTFFSICKDLENIKCDFILKHVDMAFMAWRQPWAKHLTFDEFCEYLLPYRISNEEPELWMTLFREKFGNLLTDSLFNVRECCDRINEDLINASPQITIQSINQSAIRPSSLINMKFGQCVDYTSLAVYAMRSLGVPVGTAFVPHWGNGHGGHTFNILLDENGDLIDFSGAYDKLGKSLKRSQGHAKIYQLTFGEQKESLARMHGNEAIPDFFMNPCLIDITGKFPLIGIKDISVQIPENEEIGNKFAYLCVFDRTGWCPIAWGALLKGNVVFKDVGTGIVYQLATYNKFGVNPVGDPFLLDSIGIIHCFSPRIEKSDLRLERKKEISKSLLVYPSLLVGGKFQGANTPDFHDAEDLYEMDIPDFKYKTVSVFPSKPYKFYRYLFSDTAQANIAEVEFYEKESGKKLSGKIIGEYTPSIYYPKYGPEKMFDGDALTFFHTIEDTPGWGGISLDKPVYIDKIRYIIRNDDNGIRKNELYELLYMQDGKWVSMEKKSADKDNEIIFENVPSGALYWLRNHTKGIEERIFAYENGVQVWW
jgi:hypothetical protein